MKITKLEHSGIIFEKDGKKIVCDPVEFMEKLPEMENVVAVIITHKHGDHLQLEKLNEILENNPEARVFTAPDAVSDISRAEAVRNGDEVKVGEFELKFFGKNHAEIIPGVVPCENIGVVIDGEYVNPGDSFDVPENLDEVKVLFVPSAAPWCKVTEGMEYIKTVKPKNVVPVHTAVLSDLGDGFNNNWLRVAAEEVGAELKALKASESFEI